MRVYVYKITTIIMKLCEIMYTKFYAYVHRAKPFVESIAFSRIRLQNLPVVIRSSARQVDGEERCIGIKFLRGVRPEQVTPVRIK